MIHLPITNNNTQDNNNYINDNNTPTKSTHINVQGANSDDSPSTKSSFEGANDNKNNDTRPLRVRRPPTKYEPSFTGKKYGMELFNYATNNTRIQQDDGHDLRENVFNIIFTQMSATKGIKTLGEKAILAILAILKEYQQMEDLNVLDELDPDLLTAEQKRTALRAVNLIKIKRSGKVKGRMCANGAPHRKFIPSKEAKSPTVSLGGLLCTAVVAAHERRKVISFHVPRAYLQADIPKDKFRILKLEDDFVDIMCKVNNNYSKHIRMEKGRKVLYVRILKALYGMIESTLLWYQLFVTVLLDVDFVLNPYDPCVANKVINNKQCTITWYVDDNLVTHAELHVVKDIVAKIEERLPGLTVNKGINHTFIGMDMTFEPNGELKIGLKDYITESIEAFGEDLGRTVTSPAAKWLFEVDTLCRKITPQKSDIFHSVVAKLLWISQQGRPDIATAVSFLCTRVQQPDVEDWKKLRQVLKYLLQTIDDV